jgi:ABC-type sulfate/molybdate transport systems ATPase subunit
LVRLSQTEGDLKVATLLRTLQASRRSARYTLRIESSQLSRLALLAALALFALSIIACAAFLTWMRRATG